MAALGSTERAPASEHRRAPRVTAATPRAPDTPPDTASRHRPCHSHIVVTSSIADDAGRLGAPYRLTHQIGVVDLVIAATAIELGGAVATSNVRDFPMFPGLQPPY